MGWFGIGSRRLCSYLGGFFEVRFERWFKVVLKNDNVWVSHSIRLVYLLQALLAVFNTLLCA